MNELFDMIYVAGNKTATCVNMFIVLIAMLIIHELCKAISKF